MRDIDLYQQILGMVEPWTVKRLELSVEQGRVDVWVEHRAGSGSPVRKTVEATGLPVYDHAEGRQRRHLDSMEVSDVPARAAAAGTLPRAWGASGAAAVSRADVAVDCLVRAAGHRRARAV
jgi:hypothetical protein